MGIKFHLLSSDPDDTRYVFHCPGCKCAHYVRVAGTRTIGKAIWKWNGSLDFPTVTPSILTNPNGPKEFRCHSYIRHGKIQFLYDSFHELKGQTVDLPDWESNLS
jgi:hypothetical protein